MGGIIPFIEVLLDEYPMLKIVRVGRWTHCLDYETGEGEWFHESEAEAMRERGIVAEDLRKKTA